MTTSENFNMDRDLDELNINISHTTEQLIQCANDFNRFKSVMNAVDFAIMGETVHSDSEDEEKHIIEEREQRRLQKQQETHFKSSRGPSFYNQIDDEPIRKHSPKRDFYDSYLLKETVLQNSELPMTASKPTKRAWSNMPITPISKYVDIHANAKHYYPSLNSDEANVDSSVYASKYKPYGYTESNHESLMYPAQNLKKTYLYGEQRSFIN